jgi:nitrate/nitrite-specific signal transduction histidine kinase
MVQKLPFLARLRRHSLLWHMAVVLSISLLMTMLSPVASFILAKQVQEHIALSNQVQALQAQFNDIARQLASAKPDDTLPTHVGLVDATLTNPTLTLLSTHPVSYPPTVALQRLTHTWAEQVKPLIVVAEKQPLGTDQPSQKAQANNVASLADANLNALAAVDNMLLQTQELSQALEQGVRDKQFIMGILQLACWVLAAVGFLMAGFYARQAILQRSLIINGRHNARELVSSEERFVAIVDHVDQLLVKSALGNATLSRVITELENIPGIAAGSMEMMEELAETWGIGQSITTEKATLTPLRATFIKLLAGSHTLSTYTVPESSGVPVLALSVPIKDRNRTFGVLVLEAKPGFQFEPWHIQLARVVTRQIAAAIGAVSVARESRRIALMEERAAIARELHDSIAQSLAFMKIQITRLQTLINLHHIPDDMNLVVNDLREGLNNGYRKLRELLTTFRVNVSAAGLSASLEEAIEEFRAHSGLSLTLDNRLRDCKLTANEEINILQIVREALSNVVRHAQASSAQVALAYDAPIVTVAIEDDGKGFDNTANPKFHHGASIMQERVSNLNGELHIDARGTGGTRICFSFTPSSNRNRDKLLLEA